MAVSKKRYTIYDAMEAAGVFDANPANSDSSHFAEAGGINQPQVQYPKMFYHPQGELFELVPGEVVMTPFGPKEYGKQVAVKTLLVRNAFEEKEARAAGWHDHPAKAEAAAGRPVPPMSPAGRIADLEAQIAALLAEKEANQANQKEIEHVKPLGA